MNGTAIQTASINKKNNPWYKKGNDTTFFREKFSLPRIRFVFCLTKEIGCIYQPETRSV
jgi:hypothetical protein